MRINYFYFNTFLASLIKGESASKGKKDKFKRADTLLAKSEETGSHDVVPTDSSRSIICGINPAKIKAIWNDEFQKTLIATREFEKRIQYIHKIETCNNDVLDLYVNNMNKNLSAIDSMAAQLLSGESKKAFLSFASSNEGKVKTSSTLMNKLKEYYALKTKAITEAVAKTERDYIEKQAKLAQLANDKRNQNRIDDNNRERKNLQEEYDINITEAYRQLGIKKRATTISTVSKEVYSFTITTTKAYDEIALLPIDKELLNQKLNALKNTNQLNDMKSEIDYLFVEMGEVKRKKAETDRVNFRYKIMEVIFPCYASKYDVEKENRGIGILDGFD